MQERTGETFSEEEYKNMADKSGMHRLPKDVTDEEVKDLQREKATRVRRAELRNLSKKRSDGNKTLHDQRLEANANKMNKRRAKNKVARKSRKRK